MNNKENKHSEEGLQDNQHTEEECTDEEWQEAVRQFRVQLEAAAKLEEAIKAGCRTREMANMPDGGKHLFPEETWDKIQGRGNQYGYPAHRYLVRR